MRFFPSAETVRAYIETVSGFERFLLSVGCAAINTILRWNGKIDIDTYEFLILGTVGAFIAGNVVTSVAKTKADASIGISANSKTSE